MNGAYYQNPTFPTNQNNYDVNMNSIPNSQSIPTNTNIPNNNSLPST